MAAHECGNFAAEDAVHLASAAKAGRCLVTRNRDHFIALTVRFLEQDRPHAGVLAVPYSLPGDRFSGIARAIAQYDKFHPGGILSYGLDFVALARE